MELDPSDGLFDYRETHFYIPPRFLVEAATWAVAITIARVYIQSYFLKVGERQVEKHELRKFSESWWKTIFYFVAWTWGMTIVYVDDVTAISTWSRYPELPSNPMRIYYMFQLGFYLHSVYAHFAYEVKRSDYWPLLLHHFVTIALISVSFANRVGLLVLVTHDINDILLEYGKTMVYRKVNSILLNSQFALFIISWVISRLTLFPFLCIRPAIYYSQFYVYNAPFKAYCVGMIFLYFLHIYWFYLILKILVGVVTGNESSVNDTREEKSKTR